MIVYRFDTQEHLDAWLASPERADLVAEGAPLIDGEPNEHRIARPLPTAEAATAVFSQRVPPEQVEAFRRWHVEASLLVGQFPGFLHSELVEPVAGVQDDHVIAITFDSRASLDRWLASPERAELLTSLGDLVEGDRTTSVVGGFGGWFDLPDRAPRKHKQAVAVLVALFPTSLALSWAFRTIDHGLPWPAVVFLSNVLGIVALTWVLMPRVTRALSGWLNR